ncbi:Ankyrin repeat protein 1 [Giardia muris]|uniref:Ankyrin repeat protein 1 n=1 Tax=Giardia muris TaxID=5742 RepID=A0A4Z1T420_GIAMU|nr:Ankyrin repeat protein 1 [Giardia muris]|eukprot:TNJ30398.1 Ankyrin repeat protein 1 [Giardia muris]
MDDSPDQPSLLIRKIKDSSKDVLSYLKTPAGENDKFKVYNRTSALAAACETGDLALIDKLIDEVCMRNVEPPAIFRYLAYLGDMPMTEGSEQSPELPKSLLMAEANMRHNGELPLSRLLSNKDAKKYKEWIKLLAKVTIIDSQREALKIFEGVMRNLDDEDRGEVLRKIIDFSATIPSCYAWMETCCKTCSPHPVILEYMQKVMGLYEPRIRQEANGSAMEKNGTKREDKPKGMTPLHSAVLRNNVYEVYKNAEKYKAAVDKYGNTALMYAARAGYKHCIRHLIDECAISNDKGELPTMWLAFKGYDDCLREGLLSPDLLEATAGDEGSALLWSLYNVQPTKARFDNLSPKEETDTTKGIVERARKAAIFRGIERITLKQQ